MSQVEAARANKARKLGLSDGSPLATYPVFLKLFYTLYTTIPFVFFVLPLETIYAHCIARTTSHLGRSFISEFVVGLTRFILGHSNLPQTRILFNSDRAYQQVYAGLWTGEFRNWVTRVETADGIHGRMLSPPNTKRSDDDVVFLFVHGGGFVVDTGGSSNIFWLKLMKEMNLKRKVQFSIFLVDYTHAPEHPYPSQLIECLAAYHYLVNKLGISATRICLGGDSAGGNLSAALLLHLARPNPAVFVPASLGPTPPRPAAALLISPFISLVSSLPSRFENGKYDYIDNGFVNSAALQYLGTPTTVAHLAKTGRRVDDIPSLNPYYLFADPHPRTLGITLSAEPYVKDGKGIELFNSPYVNPSVCKDAAWWKEAVPGAGRTMVTYGGKECLVDDIIEFVETLKASGVEPVTLVKEYGVHDWQLLDEVVPLVSKTKSTGPDGAKNFALFNMATFLQQIDIDERKKGWEAKAAAAKAA